ncbi:rhamnogalacturonidase [Caulobacter sp. RL271]|uniref:Glycoside hydrolase family 28 protein n=1 Tax=Caulobacter segnis TaxID=88688 RepID=A0ABY5A0N2_9CAUL|nr:glycoside hydrolase family 28 protein [Caulobacter segnis]USQ98468.1 glycoside hydrolase family 28 protein [Caulobacter segnis]
MRFDRRGMVLAGLVGAGALTPNLATAAPPKPTSPTDHWFNIRDYGAVGDGARIDTTAINKAIAAAASHGGGTVYFPPGTYASYTLRLKSKVTLLLDVGAVLLAADTPPGGPGYDSPDEGAATNKFQDYGHSHWANSLIYGEGLHDIAIVGQGLIWGKGLSRGHRFDTDPPDVSGPGVGDKAIALKNCRNVLLRDFKVLQGGWFALLATGVDNMTIDNLVVDTNRDGLDIDCCRNVRVTNCTINSPWDDGICPKSSFALGYARPTENLTISDCFLTGDFEMGSVIDGTWKRMPPTFSGYGRIKLGTESNGGFKNITITNCVFDNCYGLALETMDGALTEDIAISNIAMRGLRFPPLFLRLGSRMRGPAGAEIGKLRRVTIQNIVSHGAKPWPSIIAGVAGHPVEDIKISDVYFHQQGGGSAELARRDPPEADKAYPDPDMFGDLPANGFFIRHARNIEMSNVEIAVEAPDARPAFWMRDVTDIDLFRLRLPRGANGGANFALDQVTGFRSFGGRWLEDRRFDGTVTQTF